MAQTFTLSNNTESKQEKLRTIRYPSIYDGSIRQADKDFHAKAKRVYGETVNGWNGESWNHPYNDEE